MENYNLIIKNLIEKIKDQKFHDIEKNVYRFICELGCSITKQILEEKELEHKKTADKNKYIFKGSRNSSVKTIYGEVIYKRRQYKNREDNKYVKKNAFTYYGMYSENFIKLVEDVISKNSYRDSADIIYKLTGQCISQQSIWNIVQYIGEKYREKINTIDLFKNNKPIKTDKLFNEMDGIWINMQKSNKRMEEVKVFTSYTGWNEDGKIDNLLCYAGINSVTEFREIRENLINFTYERSNDCLHILNSDGAKWIKNMVNKSYICQLDRYHLNRAIIQTVKDKEKIKEIFIAIRKGLFNNAILIVEKLIDIEKEFSYKKRLKQLKKYLHENFSMLGNYKNLLKYQDYKKVEKEHGMGIQESLNYTLVAKRMKHNRSSWVVKGANNMLLLLITRNNKKYNIDFSNAIKCIEDNRECDTEGNLIDEILMDKGAGKLKTKVGKGYEYPSKGYITNRIVSKIIR